MRRFGATVAKGINWPDHQTFLVNNLSVQDQYQVPDNAVKWTAITAALSAVFSDTNANVGANTFTIRVTDNAALVVETTLNITVADTTAYWDRDGSTSGAGSSTPTGTWDAAISAVARWLWAQTTSCLTPHLPPAKTPSPSAFLAIRIRKNSSASE